MRPASPIGQLVGGARDLARLLVGAGPEAFSIGGKLHLHRAAALAAVALAASAGVALAARALLPGADPDLVWYAYEIFDERWVVLGYWLGVGSAVCVPLLAMQGRAWWSDAPAEEPASRRAVALRVALALGLYVLWLGPPWNLELLARPMEWHELVHLGPLQSLLSGNDFYLESRTQYGPGLQMLSLRFLERFGVSLLSFREFWLWTNFAGGFVLVGWLAFLFPALPVLAGLLVLRWFSPFNSLVVSDAGSFEFFFGWATSIKYAGVVHAVLAVAVVVARRVSGDLRITAGERGFLLASGVVYGLFVLIAQENLGCGIAALGLLGAFSLLTRVAPLGRLVTIGGTFAGGALLGVSPMLLLFAASGQVAAFVHRYFEIGGYVLQGYSSMPFEGSWLSPAGVLYALVPAAAVALFALAAFDRQRERRWRVHAAGIAALTLSCFSLGLLRSESHHILAALTPLAAFVAVAVAGLSKPGSRASIPVLAFALLPVLLAVRPAHLEVLRQDVVGRARSFAAYTEPGSGRARVGGRVGYDYDLAAPYSMFSELPLGEFLELSDRIHEKVAARPAVVASAIGTRGHWYFFADLHPHMPDPEPSMTILNSRMRARYLADLDAKGIPCVISTRPQDAEVELFRRQPGLRDEWILETSVLNFFVGCMRSPLASR